MRELVNSQTQTPFDRLFLLLVGPEGVGKTWLACTGRPSVLVMDFDGKMRALAGRKDVYALTYRDSNKSGIQPAAISDALTDLGKLEQSRSLKNLGFTLAPGQNDTVRTVAVDSIYTLGKATRDYALYSSNDITRTINIPNMPVRVPNSFDGWNAEMAAVESFILRLMGIPDIDVIVTVHETQAKDTMLSTEKQTRRSTKVTIYPERHQGIVKYFNEIWRLKRTAAGAPIITTDPDPYFVARTNFDPQAVRESGANISAMIAKHLFLHPMATPQLVAAK